MEKEVIRKRKWERNKKNEGVRTRFLKRKEMEIA
jgi:hypothetical protein